MSDKLYHRLTLVFPGSFVAETTVIPVEEWDVTDAIHIIREKKVRPYAFRFSTVRKQIQEQNGEPRMVDVLVAQSGAHYIGGKIESLEEIKLRDLPEERILRSNMECNGWNLVIKTSCGWTQPFNHDDVVLDVTL